MQKYLSALFLLLSAMNLFAAADGVAIVSSEGQQLTLQITIDDWAVRGLATDSGIFHSFTFEGAEYVGEIGAPQLPVKTVLLGVPPGADVSVQVLEATPEIISNIRLAPAPRLVREEIGYRTVYEPDEDAYRQSGELERPLVQVEAPYLFRNQRVAKIQIFPLSYSFSQQSVKKYSRLVVQVSFSGGSSLKPVTPERDEQIYKNLLLNYDQARSWRLPVQRPLLKPSMNIFQGEDWYKIAISAKSAVDREGIYKITGATLKQVLGGATPLAAINPATIQLFNNGGREISQNVVVAKNDTLIENPIVVVGGEDGRFDESDYILFYGRSTEGIEYTSQKKRFVHYINPYTYDNIYWLTFNQQNGRRIPQVNSQDISGLEPQPSFRDMAWIEEEKYNFYNSGITWLGRELTRSNNAYSVNLKLPNAVPQDQAAFRFSLASLTSGTHFFTMYANGNRLGQYSQNGSAYSYPLNETSFTADGVLLAGDNTVTVNYSVNSDAAFSYLDYIEVEYNRRFQAVGDMLIYHAPLRSDAVRYQLAGFTRNDVRIFDVTNITDIREIGNAEIRDGIADLADYCNPIISKRYIAVSANGVKNIEAGSMSHEPVTGLRNRAVSADYIIITYDDFYQQALQLESLRENWSPKERLETEVVNYSDVIREFGWGLSDPAAIRNFLAWAQDHWGNPRYVLLIGDGHFDYKDLLKQNAPNLIVPYETEGTSESYTRTTDDWFTYTRGDNAGMQLAIGRLVVRTVNETQAVVDKIVQYETAPEFGEWLKTVTIVADDEYTADGDREGIHTEQAERLAEGYVPDLLNVKKIYLINYPAVKTASISGREKPTATLELLEQINRGSLIVNYIGHGNDELWAHERVLLRTRDMDKLQNGNRLAMWIAATCEFAHWDQPKQQSFAEDILNVPSRGAVAMVSSSRLAYADQNATFNYQFYKYLFTNYGSTGLTARVGDALVLAKQLQSDKRNNEKYALFGDPAMRLCAPRFRAVIDQISPDSIQALSRMMISGHVEDLGIPLNYDGKLLVRALDTRKDYTYTGESGIEIGKLYAGGNTLFRGIVKIEQGSFNVQFIVPKDISYGGADGRISLYFWDETTSGTGSKNKIAVGGTSTNLLDNQGPRMSLNFGEPQFMPGDYVSTRPTVFLTIADSLSGVNTAGDIGHQILLTLDGNFAASRDITEYFTYNEGSYTTGTLHYSVLDLPLGEHSMQIKAWDNSNNSSIIETRFVVIDDTNLEIRNLLTFPNPMTEECTFRFELSQDAEVSVKIYTVAGRLIKKMPAMMGRVGYNIFLLAWDGRDEDGDPVANGVYLYKVTAKSYRSNEVLTAEKIEKLIIAK